MRPHPGRAPCGSVRCVLGLRTQAAGPQPCAPKPASLQAPSSTNPHLPGQEGDSTKDGKLGAGAPTRTHTEFTALFHSEIY